MNIADIKKYLANLCAISKMDTGNINAYVESVIGLGLTDFWNADAWPFRLVSTTLVLSSSTTEYDLPDDFGRLADIREKTSLLGKDLILYSKKKFDKEFPRTDAYSEGIPQACAIYYSEQQPKIAFFPTPDTMTLYIDYYSDAPSDAGDVPEEMVGGLLAAIERYLYPIGTRERAEAMAYYQAELKRMRAKKGFLGAVPDVMPDESDNYVGRNIPWVS